MATADGTQTGIAGAADRIAHDLARARRAVDNGDYDAALEVWGALGQAGNSRAQAEIGRCFVEGLGVADQLTVTEHKPPERRLDA